MGGVGGMGGGAMPDINSPEVQEQFAQMGMKPEDVLTQIDVARFLLITQSSIENSACAGLL